MRWRVDNREDKQSWKTDDQRGRRRTFYSPRGSRRLGRKQLPIPSYSKLFDPAILLDVTVTHAGRSRFGKAKTRLVIGQVQGRRPT